MSEEEAVQLWYYLDLQGEQVGPVPASELLSLASVDKIRPESYVWTDVLEDWIPASKVGGLFQQVAPPRSESAAATKEAANAKPRKSASTAPGNAGMAGGGMNITLPLESDTPTLKRKTVDSPSNPPAPAMHMTMPLESDAAPIKKATVGAAPGAGKPNKPAQAAAPQQPARAPQPSQPAAPAPQPAPQPAAPAPQPTAPAQHAPAPAPQPVAAQQIPVQIPPLNLPIQPRGKNDITSHQVEGGIKCGLCHEVTPSPGPALLQADICKNQRCNARLLLPEEKVPADLLVNYVTIGILGILSIVLLVSSLGGQKEVASEDVKTRTARTAEPVAQMGDSLGPVGGSIAFLLLNGGSIGWLLFKRRKNFEAINYNTEVRRKIVEHEAQVMAARASTKAPAPQPAPQAAAPAMPQPTPAATRPAAPSTPQQAPIRTVSASPGGALNTTMPLETEAPALKKQTIPAAQDAMNSTLPLESETPMLKKRTIPAPNDPNQ